MNTTKRKQRQYVRMAIRRYWGKKWDIMIEETEIRLKRFLAKNPNFFKGNIPPVTDHDKSPS